MVALHHLRLNTTTGDRRRAEIVGFGNLCLMASYAEIVETKGETEENPKKKTHK
jgi:hypothetical protein